MSTDHNPPASRAREDETMSNTEEDAHVIERMGKLLARIAIIVNGPQPKGTLWSYHDLPEKVVAMAEASRRERIATAAMQGLLASVVNVEEFRHPNLVAAESLAYADALIAELDRKGEEG